MRLILIPLLLTLTACAPSSPTEADARAAMTGLLESARQFDKVTVEAIHTLELTECRPATPEEGTVCKVRMDVSFTVDDQANRDDDTDWIRFTRENGRWKAHHLSEEPLLVP